MIKRIENFICQILGYSYDSKSYRVLLTNRYGVQSTESIPVAHLADSDRVSLPSEMRDSNGLIIVGTELNLVSLENDMGYSRYAPDAKVYISAASPKIDPEIEQLIRDLYREEDHELEQKASMFHPADPANAGDHAAQFREIIRQCQAFANSKTHRGRIIVGVREKDGQRTLVGVENEVSEFSPGANFEIVLANLRNMMQNLTSPQLMLATDCRFINIQHHTVLVIDINYEGRGDVVFFGNKHELNVRVGSSMMRINDTTAYLSFIRNFKN